MKLTKERGGIGVGMSSIGPTIYCFGSQLNDIANFFNQNKKINYLNITKPDNSGIKIRAL
ncbi:hypothetical protein ES708_33338 [subsurface metagenome]